VITPEAVPFSVRDSLPPGYLILRRLDVSAKTAVFEATIGPVGRSHANEEAWTCGTRVKYFLTRTTNKWSIGPSSYTVC
jgi:hypothetical protein